MLDLLQLISKLPSGFGLRCDPEIRRSRPKRPGSLTISTTVPSNAVAVMRAPAQLLAVDFDRVLGHAAGGFGLDLEQRLRLAGCTRACGAARQRSHPLREVGGERRLQVDAHVAPGARGQDVAAAYRQRAQRVVDVFGDAALRAEHLSDLFAAGFDAGLGRERILVGQGLREGLIDLGVPDLVQLGLRRLHGHGVALDQRADQQRTQGLALRRRQAGQHLLVDQLERVGQLRVLAFQRLAHQQQRARTRVALVVDQVETRADLRQGVHVVAQQRLVVARDHQAGHVGELAAHRPHRDLLPAGRDFGGLGLALAQDHPLEPGDHARLCLRNAGVDQRGVVLIG
ncbi:hypothetical protein G6F22_015173 [Rhizopus arrhizus]|nr:hypothetical protein G6F22_015173 [Rhizopus arrhizus]